MKTFRVLFIVALCVTCFLFSGVVSALEENDVSVTVTLSTQTAYRGGLLGTRVTVVSHYYEDITIAYLGLHFDWMDVDYFEGQNMSDNLVTLSAFESFVSNLILISIPENVSVGSHSYYVGIDGIQGSSTGFSWDSEMFALNVYVPEEVYNGLIATVSSGIVAGENANYQGSNAKSLLVQAQDAYSQAVVLAGEDKFVEAISVLQDASGYLELAAVEEQNYVETVNLYVTVLIIFALVVAVLVIALWFIRKRKKASRRKRRGASTTIR